MHQKDKREVKLDVLVGMWDVGSIMKIAAVPLHVDHVPTTSSSPKLVSSVIILGNAVRVRSTRTICTGNHAVGVDEVTVVSTHSEVCCSWPEG